MSVEQMASCASYEWWQESRKANKIERNFALDVRGWKDMRALYPLDSIPDTKICQMLFTCLFVAVTMIDEEDSREKANGKKALRNTNGTHTAISRLQLNFAFEQCVDSRLNWIKIEHNNSNFDMKIIRFFSFIFFLLILHTEVAKKRKKCQFA